MVRSTIVIDAKKEWRCAHIGPEGDYGTVGGLRVWDHDWRRVKGKVRLPHPSYPGQMHEFHIFEIGRREKPVRFAAAELSRGLWGFYVHR
jgi:hypothetical protein